MAQEQSKQEQQERFFAVFSREEELHVISSMKDLSAMINNGGDLIISGNGETVSEYINNKSKAIPDLMIKGKEKLSYLKSNNQVKDKPQEQATTVDKESKQAIFEKAREFYSKQYNVNSKYHKFIEKDITAILATADIGAINSFLDFVAPNFKDNINQEDPYKTPKNIKQEIVEFINGNHEKDVRIEMKNGINKTMHDIRGTKPIIKEEINKPEGKQKEQEQKAWDPNEWMESISPENHSISLDDMKLSNKDLSQVLSFGGDSVSDILQASGVKSEIIDKINFENPEQTKSNVKKDIISEVNNMEPRNILYLKMELKGAVEKNQSNTLKR